MTIDTKDEATDLTKLYSGIFEALPGYSYLLRNDAPRYTILAVTQAVEKLTGLKKADLVGKGLFASFPSNPDNPADTGENNLRVSLDHVLRYKKAHQLPVQRYDLTDEKGQFVKRYWKAENNPVFAPDGSVAFVIHTSEDITDEVIAQEREMKLADIEKAFSLFMHAPMVVGLVNGEDYVLEMANDEAFKFWGKTREEIIGKPILQGLPEMAGQGIIELMKQVRTTGKPYFAYEVPVTSFREGSTSQHYFNLVYQPYYSNGSALSGVFTISHDVTEQVRARQKAQESEVRFRTMAESTPVLITVSDETGNVTYFNKAWTDLTGRPMEELLRFGWTDLVHSEDREHFVKTYTDAFAAKGPFTDEFRVQNATGKHRWLLAHGAPRFDAEGNFVGHISACTDITEHKESQRQLQTALEQVRLSKEAAELGTFDMDLEKGTMHWDERCRILFGISHNNPVSYEVDFVGGLHPDDRDRILKIIEQLFIRPALNGDYDVEYRTVGVEDGLVRWIRAKGKVYFDKQEKPLRFIGSVLDISEKVTAMQKIEAVVEERTKELEQTNEKLLQANRELQRSNQNLEEFAHAASHDLKEPVRKIHFFTQKLREQLKVPFKEAEEQSFNRIQNATERMGNLIDDLLLYSHVSQRPHEKESVDLNQKIQRVLDDLELDVQEKRAVIQVAKLPVVKGYRRQLQQLFQNLISNALKYTRQDEPPQIFITASVVTKNKTDYDVIEVKDNGIGFEQAYADKIFQTFTRLHGKSEYSGTGVGLSIAKKVVENHNGFFDVKSSPGMGATFSVYLPKL